MFMLPIAKRGNYTSVQWVNLLLSARILNKNQENSYERDDFVMPLKCRVKRDTQHANWLFTFLHFLF